MARRICKMTVTLEIIFRLVHCNGEDVSFNSTCLNVFEGIKQFFLLMWFKLKIVSEYDQEIPQSQTADNPMAPTRNTV